MLRGSEGRSRCVDEIVDFVLEKLESVIVHDIDKGRASPAKEYMNILAASISRVLQVAARCVGDGLVHVTESGIGVDDAEKYRKYMAKALLELRMKVFDKAMEALSKFVDVSGTTLYARLSALLLAYASSLMELIDHAYALVSAAPLPPELLGFVEGIVVASAARFYAFCRLLSVINVRRLSEIMDKIESIVEGFIGQDVAMKYVVLNVAAGLRSQGAQHTRIPGL